jgi:hypothetical protein
MAEKVNLRLNGVIDNVILTMLEADGTAATFDIYHVLRNEHRELVEAELEEDARRGLMRRIDKRFKHISDLAVSEDKQPLLPGLPHDLQRRMGRLITVDEENGRSSHRYLMHPSTKVGHVRPFLDMLKKQRSALEMKTEAFTDALQRCGTAKEHVSFVKALESALKPRTAKGC